MELDLHASLDMSDVAPPSPPRSPSASRRLSGLAHTGLAASSTGRRASNLFANFVMSVSQSLSAIPHAAPAAAADSWTSESPARSPPRTPARTPSPSLMSPRGLHHEGGPLSPVSKALPESPSLTRQRPSLLGERPGTPTTSSSRDVFVSTAALMVPEYADLDVPVIDAFRVALARRTVSQGELLLRAQHRVR